MKFSVPLREIERRTKKGVSKSISFIIPPAKIKELELIPKDVIYIHACGIFAEKNQTDPSPLDLSFYAEVSKAGGSSLQITIRKNYVNRYNLKNENELVIDQMVVTKKVKPFLQ